MVHIVTARYVNTLLIRVLLVAGPMLGFLPSRGTAQKSIPAPTLSGEVDKAITKLGSETSSDSSKILAWVQANIQQQSYDGVLKGARGVFISRAGNSLDTAMLVATSLRQGNPNVELRFASCPAVNSENFITSPATLAIDNGPELESRISDPTLKAQIQQFAQSWTFAHKVVAAESASLAVDLAKPFADIKGSPRHETSVHAWIQVKGSEGWTDLDPTGSVTGQAPCQASSVAETLPAEEYQRLTIRVVVERRQAGTLSTSDALAVTLPTADLAASRVAFAFAEALPFQNRAGASCQASVAADPLALG